MVTFCAESYTCQMIALTDDGGYEAGQMFYPTLNEKRELDIFITGEMNEGKFLFCLPSSL